MIVTRRKFVEGIGAGTVVLSLNACGGGDGGSGPGFGAGCSATGIANIANHGHTLTVPAADLSSGASKTYNIQGTADHNHQVTFTPAQLTDLRNGNSVIVTSTAGTNVANGSHTHVVTTRC